MADNDGMRNPETGGRPAVGVAAGAGFGRLAASGPITTGPDLVIDGVGSGEVGAGRGGVGAAAGDFQAGIVGSGGNSPGRGPVGAADSARTLAFVGPPASLPRSAKISTGAAPGFVAAGGPTFGVRGAGTGAAAAFGDLLPRLPRKAERIHNPNDDGFFSGRSDDPNAGGDESSTGGGGTARRFFGSPDPVWSFVSPRRLISGMSVN